MRTTMPLTTCGPRPRRLLPSHGDAQALLGVDEVVVVVVTELDLHPVDRSGEAAGLGRVVGGPPGARLVADVRRLVGGEHHRLGRLDTARAHGRTVVVQGDVASL